MIGTQVEYAAADGRPGEDEHLWYDFGWKTWQAVDPDESDELEEIQESGICPLVIGTRFSENQTFPYTEAWIILEVWCQEALIWDGDDFSLDEMYEVVERDKWDLSFNLDEWFRNRQIPRYVTSFDTASFTTGNGFQSSRLAAWWRQDGDFCP